MNIRKAKKKDLKYLKKIYLNAGIDEIKIQYPKESKKEIIKKINLWSKEIFQNFEKEINSRKAYWIIVEIENKIIGFANSKISVNSIGWLNRNYIEKKYRKKGIGKKLTEQRINWLKENKIKNIFSRIFMNNKISKNNLKNFGFKPIEIIMEKKLK